MPCACGGKAKKRDSNVGPRSTETTEEELAKEYDEKPVVRRHAPEKVLGFIQGGGEMRRPFRANGFFVTERK